MLEFKKWLKLSSVVLVTILILLIVMPVTTAGAAQQGNVVVTATGAYMAITATPNTYDFGTVDASVVSSTKQSNFSVNSSSSITIHVLISFAAPTSGGIAWTLNSAAAYNIAHFDVSADTGTFGTAINAAATSYNLTDNLAASAGKGWEIRMNAPTSFSDGNQNSINITLSAYRA